MYKRQLTLLVVGCSSPGSAASTTYTVTYNANGASGNVPIDSKAYKAGDTVTVLGNTGTPPLTRTLVASPLAGIFRLVAFNPPTIALSPTTLTFSANTGGVDPAAQTVSVTDIQPSSTLSGLSASVDYVSGTGWLGSPSIVPTTITTGTA